MCASVFFFNIKQFHIWLLMLTFGLAFGMVGASSVNAPMPMMNAAGLGNLSSVSSPPSLYSINNMAASLLAQSKFQASHKFIEQQPKSTIANKRMMELQRKIIYDKIEFGLLELDRKQYHVEKDYLL